MSSIHKQGLTGWRKKLYIIIYEADTPGGKLFDVLLLVAILLSILMVMLESVESINAKYGDLLYLAEWTFTVFFTLEYFVRIVCISKPTHYIFSFYGIIDLLSILPSYLGLFFTGYHSLIVIRSIRLLRVFRILKLARFTSEAGTLMTALKASRIKITVFLGAVTTLVIIIGTIMYIVEAGHNTGFTSIPRSIYWAIVTLTTVGYGDISPETTVGQFLASVVMILGYAIIAVPTGLVSAEMVKGINTNHEKVEKKCHNCGLKWHDNDASYCKNCGTSLEKEHETS